MNVIKDEENERQIPPIWRPVFCQIVKQFAIKDYRLSSPIPNVTPLTIDDSRYIEEYIQSYGEELTELPSQTWDTSIYLWMGSHWEVIVDLWTVGEGSSDLVMSARVYETNEGFKFSVHAIYVP